MRWFSKAEARDVLLSVDWALFSFLVIEITPFEIISKSLIKNLGGVALFALFIIVFELFGKGLAWRVVGKHHRLGRQIIALMALLFVLAWLFTMVA